MEGATMAKLTSMHFYAWKSGLKTGMYYLRTKSAVDAIKFTLDNKATEKAPSTQAETVVAGASIPAKATAATASKQQIEVNPLSPEELKQMLSQSQNNPDDDCLMCGS